MRILCTSIIDVDRAPNGRLHYVVEQLSEDHELTILCPFDTWRERLLAAADRYGSRSRMSALDNVEVIYLTERGVPMMAQEVLSEALLRGHDIDYGSYDVHFDYSTLFLGEAVHRRAARAGVPTLYDLMDDVIAMVRESPQLRWPLGHVGAAAARRLLRRNLDRADRITYTTEPLRAAMAIPPERSAWIPNGVDVEAFDPEVEPKTEARPDAEFVVGYVGTNREWVDMRQVVDAVASLRAAGEDVGFLLVGEEGGLEGVRDRVSFHGITDACSFVGTVPYAEVPAYVRAMDVGTIPFRRGNPISEHSLPLKLFEYAACGVPVVSSPLPGIEDVASEEVLFADDAAAFARQFRTLADDPEGRAERGRASRALAERFAWPAQVEQLEAELRSVAEEGR